MPRKGIRTDAQTERRRRRGQYDPRAAKEKHRYESRHDCTVGRNRAPPARVRQGIRFTDTNLTTDLLCLVFKQARLFDDSPQPPIITGHREKLLKHDEGFQVSHHCKTPSRCPVMIGGWGESSNNLACLGSSRREHVSRRTPGESALKSRGAAPLEIDIHDGSNTAFANCSSLDSRHITPAFGKGLTFTSLLLFGGWWKFSCRY